MKKLIIWIILTTVLFMWCFSHGVYRTIIPKGWIGPRPEYQPGEVWETYNAEAEWNQELPWYAFASWTFTWTTIMNYMKYLVQFLSGIWLVIWAVMIMFGWYKYALWVFTGKATTGNEPIKLAIQGILVIIFSFAIIRFLLAALWWEG